MSQRPMPIPRRTPPAPETGSSWSWNLNLGGLNPILNAMLERWQNMADINVAEAETGRGRNALAFQDWLRKRQFERDMATKQYENVRDVQAEDRRRYDMARGDVDKARMDAENNCAALRAQGIPCANPSSGGSTYGGSSSGGVPAARPSLDYGRPATPAWGPTETYRGVGDGTTIVNNPNYSASPGQFVSGGGGASMPSSRIDIPDFWETSAETGGSGDMCRSESGASVPCSECGKSVNCV